MKEITLYDNIGDPMSAMNTLGQMFIDSKMFGCTTHAQGCILALSCMTERKSPSEIMAKNHIIEGKLAMRADAMLAEIENAGWIVDWIQWSDECAEATFAKKGRNTITLKLTFEEMLRKKYPWKKDFKESGMAGKVPSANLHNALKDNWRDAADAMLRARLVSKAARMIAPGAVSGAYTPEEVRDFDEFREPQRSSAPLFTDKKLDDEKKATSTTPEYTVEDDAPETEKKGPEIDSPFDPETDDKLKASEEKVNEYLLSKKWILPGTTYRQLPAANVTRISKNTEAFLKAAGV